MEKDAPADRPNGPGVTELRLSAFAVGPDFVCIIGGAGKQRVEMQGQVR